jgi:hypothetical protein
MKTMRTTLPFAALLIAALAATPLGAVDLASLGITVISATPDGGRTVYELQDSRRNRLTVVGDKEVTEAQVKAVLYLRDSLTGWQNMTLPSLRITLSGDKAEALVVPSAYGYQGTELTRYLPSGMRFYLDSIIEYDFRMKVGTLFLRVKGQLFGEQELGARLVAASKDPVGFLQQTDPEYLFRTVQEVVAELKALQEGDAMSGLRDLLADYQLLKAQKPLLERKLGELDAGTAALSSAVGKLASNYQELQAAVGALGVAMRDRAAEISAKEEADIAAVEAEMEGLRAELIAAGRAEVERLDAADKELAAKAAQAETDRKAEAEAAAAEIARLRLSMLTLHNTGLFRGPTVMDAKMVARVVELKRANTAMTANEIVTALKAEKVSASKKQVELILYVYFPTGG